MSLSHIVVSSHSASLLAVLCGRALFFFPSFCTGTEKKKFLCKWFPRSITLIHILHRLFLSFPFLFSTVNQFEHVVEDEIAAGVIGQKLKNLGVVHRSLFLVHLKETTRSAPAPLPLCRRGLRPERVQRLGRSYQQCPCDHDDDAASLVGGLRVQSRDLMLDLLKG